jgi:hypothetical protein
MRKAIASVGLAAMLSLGIGTAAVAQEAPDTTEEASEDDGFQWGILGLGGLLGLAGLARGGGGGGKPGKPGKPGKAPRGGYTSDWTNR